MSDRSPDLVAVAHGSRDAAAAVATGALLDAVRAARPGLTVHECYLDHGRPGLTEVAAGLTEAFVVVPLLLGAAFHSDVDVPARLDESGRAHLAQVSAVLGDDDAAPLLLGALGRRLAEVGAGGDGGNSGGTAVVLAAAGATGEASVAAARGLAAQWQRTGRWHSVTAAFVSAADPTVAQAVAAERAAGARRVAVASYLLFPGRFADVVADSGADVVAPPLGDAPEIVELILRRYDQTIATTRPEGPLSPASRAPAPIDS